MRDVVIAGYLRTGQSRSRPKDPARDWFNRLRGDELLAKLLPEIIKRTGIEAKEIDDFLVGCATAIGEQWAYGGRFPIFLANLPETLPAKFIDQQCGSSMAAIHVGFMEIAMGFADVVLAGGYEHMTRVPMGEWTTERGFVAPNVALFADPSYSHWDMMTAVNMGLTAEKLFTQADFTKEDMDRWGVRSHQLAAKAQAEGFFDGEIMPIEAEQADGTVMTVDKDQSVRRDATLVLMSKEDARRRGIRPLATIRSIGFAGVAPSIMGTGPVPASRMALERTGLQVSDIDYWEINEAFCIVALNCIKELGIDPERVNVMGGGTAIGHPLGATGTRLVGTLARILNRNEGRWGCANACVGGGQGVATVIEREDYDW
jgi:acetyl-CoA acyltransferase